MKLAISGSAGCGKSTLARTLAKRLNATYVSEMYEGLAGVQSLISYRPREAAARFAKVLDAKLARQAQETSFVVDRSPVDLLNLWLQLTLGRLDEETAAFQARCTAAMGEFDRVVMPPWGVMSLVSEDGAPLKRNLNRWVQLTNHAAIRGLVEMSLSRERILIIPSNTPPERWAEFVLCDLSHR